MSGIAPAQAPPFGIIFRNIWTRSDPSMTIPLLNDSSDQGIMSNDLTNSNPDPASQSLQHSTTTTTTTTTSAPSTNNNNSSTSTNITHGKTESSSSSSGGGSTGTGTGMEDLMSRGDVFAGVIVFSVGMLVLIVAVTFYFANGRSLRTVRRNRGLENNNGSSAQRRSRGGGTDGGREEVVGAGDDIDLEQNNNAVDTTVTGTGVEPGDAGTLEKVSTFDPHSPSTARLIDHHPSSPSVFAFLKGTPSPSSSSPSFCHHHRHSSNLSLPLKSSQIGIASSTISKTGNNFDPPTTESTTFHMPVLTRTKARSSCKKKSKGMISLFSSIPTTSSGTGTKKQKQIQQQAAAAMEIARSASAIIIKVQEPSEPASATPLTPLTPLDTYHHHTDTHSSNHTSSSSSNRPSPLDQEEDSLEETFAPIHPISTTTTTTPSTTDNHHPLLRLEMPTTVRSSSVVGLYGSAKSSPNGSMIDAASTRAIYCTSIKSAISFLPTESTSMLGAIHTADLGGGTGVGAGQDIVIATAGLES
ncbi:hypothetical protein K457DRAFT_19763 [Linnemannia elongata AG-77]|uniref:Uncharacterized protein n=1 Tax=Linnemannia elongata AG-77 TaxID=1314771 RepID=A0A197JV46_9FUNG|nr:hypothetical protein K457DRAFT_19763 [Linnemannia elongata AG-77]